jgi:hypothetical protein
MCKMAVELRKRGEKGAWVINLSSDRRAIPTCVRGGDLQTRRGESRMMLAPVVRRAGWNRQGRLQTGMRRLRAALSFVQAILAPYMIGASTNKPGSP